MECSCVARFINITGRMLVHIITKVKRTYVARSSIKKRKNLTCFIQMQGKYLLQNTQQHSFASPFMTVTIHIITGKATTMEYGFQGMTASQLLPDRPIDITIINQKAQV